jgi:L-malate glycosyltransferase
MRIAHCILEPRYSGAEILVLNLVRSQIAAGASVAVIALRPSEPAFEEELSALARYGCQLFIPRKPLIRQERLLWIRRATRSFSPNVIFAHSLLPSLYSRLALLGISNVAVVTVLHTDEDFKDAKARAFERVFWRRSAVVVGVSPASLRNYRKRVTEKQTLRLIRNGVDLDSMRLPDMRAQVRKDVFSALDGDVILLQIGRISAQKQQHLTIEALSALGKQISLDRIRLFFAGAIETQSYYDRLNSTAEALGVAGKIVFLGSRKDVAQLLAGADVHLMPSGWEAQSIAAIEALASGIFCVFSRIESFLPYESLAGVEVLPLDATDMQMAASLREIIEAADMPCRYFRDLRDFSFEKCAGEYMQLANSLGAVGS